MKDLLTQELVSKGATDKIVSSFVMSLDTQELQLYRSNNLKKDGEVMD